MATPPELTQTVSEATGVALATVVDMDRRLVKAKLRTKGGRGLNAARMTELDAARLLGRCGGVFHVPFRAVFRSVRSRASDLDVRGVIF